MKNYKVSAMVLGAFVLGAASTIFVTTRDQVAPWYSRAIYDCGIRIGAGATGWTLSDFKITGHKWGVCVDSPESSGKDDPQ